MKFAFFTVVVFAVGGLFQCSAEGNGRPLPSAVIVDSFGGIDWARAPVGYYAKSGDERIRQYSKTVGLKDAEVPLFSLDADTLRRIYDIAREGNRASETGKMNFVLVFFYEDGRSAKFIIDREHLREVVDVLPVGIAGRLFSMYSNAVRFNNPK